MKRIVILLLVVLCAGYQPIFAQKSAPTDNYRYYKALELIEENGFVPEAQQLLIDNISYNPKHILSYLPLISSYREERKFNDALQLVNTAIALNHKNSEVSDAKLLWWKACIYDDFGRVDESIYLMEQAVKKGKKIKEKGLEDFQKALAQMYYDAGRFDESDRVYNELLKVNSDSQLALVGISRNMIARGNYADALEVLLICERMDPNYHEIYRFKTQAYYGVGEYKKAIESMITHYEMTQNYDYIYYSLFQKSKKYSIALLKQKIVATADNADWKTILAELYSNCYMYYDATQVYTEMIEEYGEVSFLLKNRATTYSSLELVDLALNDINLAIKNSESENPVDLYLIRSGIYTDAGMYSEALKDINVFIDRYPTYTVGYYFRGYNYFMAGDYENALSSFSDGIELDETYSSNYLQRARSYILLTQREKALPDLDKILSLEPEPSENRAFALHYMGRNSEALDCIQTLIEENPHDGGNYYNLACLNSLMGKSVEAVAALKTAFELGYNDFRHIEKDIDLDRIRNREDFKALIEKYHNQLKADAEKMCTQVVKPQQENSNGNSVYTEVQMKKQYGGTYEVPCMVNGLPLMMIFDTGAADVTISTVEASFMFKNGYLKESDIKGSRNYVTADGGVHAGTVITLKEVKLGDAVLKNVQASVVHNQKAPLLLGQSVLERFGKITIDNVNLKITIQQ
jgi:clan AA aspartic protease (TIGR02281 family)